MDLQLSVAQLQSGKLISVSGSKSETNRLLLLQALFPEIRIENASVSDDSVVMLEAIKSFATTIDVHHAGTAMRFLTAYFAQLENREVVLTGSARMKQRPIGILVDALRELGAAIDYLERDGFPPLRISGRKLSKDTVTLKANVSSQYISALLLIAPKMQNGIKLTLEGEVTSVPYINMTLGLLHEIGIETSFIQNKITVTPSAVAVTPSAVEVLTVESDWSSASYYYSIIALSEPGTQITLSSYKQNSLQGDSALAQIYTAFGVQTTFSAKDQIVLTNVQQPAAKSQQPVSCTLHLNQTPDIAQTIAVTCFGLGIGCHLTGLHTLKIKETDRLEALKTELQKLGANVSITHDSLTLEASSQIIPDIKIATYNDHRMAMAFAPLALKTSVIIENAEVVSKSYPGFWEDLKAVGFQINTLS